MAARAASRGGPAGGGTDDLARELAVEFEGAEAAGDFIADSALDWRTFSTAHPLPPCRPRWPGP
eukprot:7359563-Lingulodinium_polyedra.AAC.1